MPIDDTVHGVVIGPDADELRCRLGPASWTVLEAMMQRASETDAGLAVAVSIRSLASSLGLSKDTIARSVRRLRDAGLVGSIQRRDTSGAFAAGSYRLAVPRSCLSLVSSSVPVAGVPAFRICASRPMNSAMRRVLLLAPLVAGLAVACSDEGSTSVDRQRLESVEASELFDVRLPGLQVETPFNTSLATTKTAVLNDGSTTNAAGISYSFEAPPEAADVQAVAVAYVDAFVKEGWSDITARCIPTPEGATDVIVSGKRWVDDHEQSGGVELNPLLPNWSVVVVVSAPHHSETGDQPIGNEPQVDCLEEIQVPDEN